jgi:hypothetical protein
MNQCIELPPGITEDGSVTASRPAHATARPPTASRFRRSDGEVRFVAPRPRRASGSQGTTTTLEKIHLSTAAQAVTGVGTGRENRIDERISKRIGNTPRAGGHVAAPGGRSRKEAAVAV